jgi:hypothetical protein
MKRVLSWSIRFAVPLVAATMIPSGLCFAWYGQNGKFFDGQTRYMWSRTWHGPNSLATPLSQYFVPRTPGDCGSGGFASALNCTSGVAAGEVVGQYGGLPYTAAGFEPTQFERLGRVPNELDIIGNLGDPPAGQAGVPRR